MGAELGVGGKDAADQSAVCLTAIAAVGSNGVIGDGQGLLWHLPEDFSRFKAVTMGGVLVMGRRTYESLGSALKGRVSVVMTRDEHWHPSNTAGSEVIVAQGLPQVGHALAERSGARWWCCGGGEIYRALWPYTTDLDVTQVHAAPVGAVTFPTIDPTQWSLTRREARAEFDFVGYTRVDPTARAALSMLVGYEN